MDAYVCFLLLNRRRKNNILACLCECIFQCLERIIRYFNAYAYVQVAIYGVSYLKAAKNTFKLISRRGLEGLINDNLVGPVLFLSSLFGAGLTFLIAYLWAGSYGSFNSDERVVVSVFALLVIDSLLLVLPSHLCMTCRSGSGKCGTLGVCNTSFVDGVILWCFMCGCM